MQHATGENERLADELKDFIVNIYLMMMIIIRKMNTLIDLPIFCDKMII